MTVNKVTINLDAVESACAAVIDRLKRDGWPWPNVTWHGDSGEDAVKNWDATKSTYWPNLRNYLRNGLILFLADERKPLDEAVDAFFKEHQIPGDWFEDGSQNWRWQFFEAQYYAVRALSRPEPNMYEANGITAEEVKLYGREIVAVVNEFIKGKRAEAKTP